MKTTRRTFLGGVAVASLPASAGTFVAVTAEKADAAVVENPDLIAAYDRMTAAHNELADAKSSLEWIADEWRHRWPLAPDELLHCANADWGGGADTAERDIVGNFIYRNTLDVPRLSRKFVENTERTCFTIATPAEAIYWLDNFQARKPSGRTERALNKSKEIIDRNVRKYKRQIELALAYEAETTRMREVAGVEMAKQRIRGATCDVEAICGEISNISAFTPEGLTIKAEALKASGIFEAVKRGPLLEMARFIQSVIEIGGRASA